MPVRRWSNGNSPSLVAGMHDSTTFEDSLEVSYKTKYTFTIQSSNCTLWYLSKGTENIFSGKTDICMFIPALHVTAKTRKQPRCP